MNWIELNKENKETLEVQQLRSTQAFIAIEFTNKLDKEKGNIVHLKPVLESTELFTFAGNDRAIILDRIYKMMFLGEHKLLFQFSKIPEQDEKGCVISKNASKDKFKTVILEENGLVIQQSKEN